MSNYPPGTWEGDPRAPWNQSFPPRVEDLLETEVPVPEANFAQARVIDYEDDGEEVSLCLQHPDGSEEHFRLPAVEEAIERAAAQDKLHAECFPNARYTLVRVDADGNAHQEQHFGTALRAALWAADQRQAALGGARADDQCFVYDAASPERGSFEEYEWEKDARAAAATKGVAALDREIQAQALEDRAAIRASYGDAREAATLRDRAARVRAGEDAGWT